MHAQRTRAEPIPICSQPIGTVVSRQAPNGAYTEVRPSAALDLFESRPPAPHPSGGLTSQTVRHHRVAATRNSDCDRDAMREHVVCHMKRLRKQSLSPCFRCVLCPGPFGGLPSGATSRTNTVSRITQHSLEPRADGNPCVRLTARGGRTY